MIDSLLLAYLTILFLGSALAYIKALNLFYIFNWIFSVAFAISFSYFINLKSLKISPSGPSSCMSVMPDLSKGTSYKLNKCLFWLPGLINLN